MKLANMKNFILIVNDELNNSSFINVTGLNDELVTKNEFTFFVRYTENTLYTYSVVLNFDENSDVVRYTVNYIDDDGVQSCFNSVSVNNAYELAQVVICVCAIDTNACVIKFNNFDDDDNEFMNFDNSFCIIVPIFDDLPYTVEFHTVNNIAVYSVCGAHHDTDFENMSTALHYFCTLCDYKID